MAGLIEQPKVILSGFKERAECLTVQGMFVTSFAVHACMLKPMSVGDRLYIGTSIGSLHIYKYEDTDG